MSGSIVQWRFGRNPSVSVPHNAQLACELQEAGEMLVYLSPDYLETAGHRTWTPRICHQYITGHMLLSVLYEVAVFGRVPDTKPEYGQMLRLLVKGGMVYPVSQVEYTVTSSALEHLRSMADLKPVEFAAMARRLGSTYLALAAD